MTSVFIIYSISILLIVLGFFALLRQKTYIDSNTKMPSEVEIPMLGKFKTNYPALIFVFLGFALSVIAFKKPIGKEVWYVKGSITRPPNKKVDWEKGQLWVIPSTIISPPVFKSNGEFEFEIQLDKGMQFEKVIRGISFTFDSIKVEDINTQKEFVNFRKKNNSSLLFDATKFERNYIGIKADTFQLQ